MLISVVIPTHNRLANLQESLASVLNQTVLPDEVIVVDDGSATPVTDAVFEGFPNTISTLLIRNEVPMGGNNARNKGVLATAADYIAFLDDDDRFKQNKIEELRKTVEQNPEADVIYHPAHIHMVNEGVSYYSRPRVFKSGENIYRILLLENVIGGTPMVTLKRDTLLKVGLFDEKMPALQDHELWLRMAYAGAKFYFLNSPLTDYEQKTNVSSVTKNENLIISARSLLDEKYHELLTLPEKEKIKFSRLKGDLLRSLLNGDSRMTRKLSLQCFKITKNPKFILAILASIAGRKFFLKAYFLTRRHF